ncbi:HAAS signaling domain-containing protein [Paenibacillus sp. BAC0078]
MDQIKRYIHEVTRQLPEQQRSEIGKELEGLIGDMLEERLQDGSPGAAKDVEEVLLELGNPRQLADRYRGSSRYLIGPELFAPYVSVLKIVCIAIIIAITVEFAITSIIQPVHQPELTESGMLDRFVNYIADLFMGGLQGFTSVTIIFGLIEYTGLRKGKAGFNSKKDWHPSQLPPLPTEHSKIRRSEPVAGLIFTILFGVLFTTISIDWLGAWRFRDGGGMSIVPLFDGGIFRGYLPLIWVFLAASIIRDTLKIIVGKWTETLVIFNIVISILGFGLALLMFTNPEIWNPDFMAQMVQAGIVQDGSEAYGTLLNFWNSAAGGLIFIVGIVFVIDLIVAVSKLFKLRSAA